MDDLPEKVALPTPPPRTIDAVTPKEYEKFEKGVQRTVDDATENGGIPFLRQKEEQKSRRIVSAPQPKKSKKMWYWVLGTIGGTIGGVAAASTTSAHFF